MCRLGWLVPCVLVLMAVPCLARTWTDLQGQQVQGEFVRVLKGRVVVSVGGRAIQIPFGHLIDDDQEFVREQLEARGQSSFLPARKKAIKSKSADPASAEDAELTAVAERTWTDVAGRKVRARFLDVENAKVILQVRGKRSSFPFEKFSTEDQQYVRAEMTTRGQAEKVPTVSLPNSPPPAPPVPQVARSLPPPHPPATPWPAVPEIKIPEVKLPAPIRPTIIPPSVPPPIAPQMARAPLPVIPTVSSPVSPSFDMPTTQKFCENCKKALPSSITAGDNCPYCGVYFEYEDLGSGMKKHAPLSWKTFTAPSGIGALIVIVISVVARWRRYSR